MCKCILHLVFIIFCLLPLGPLIMGAIYDEEDCHIAKLSLLLLIGGIIGLSHSVIEVFRLLYNYYSESSSMVLRILTSLLLVCQVFWFIVTGFTVYTHNQPNYYDVNSRAYCRKSLFVFTFWWTTVGLSFICLTVFCGLCLVCIIGVGAKSVMSRS
ncbi:hypothetical protein HDE_02153 [Halotydeus destructor]|nr:hypothetical protein HDE_02153 [Halotydeus destructor]